MASVAEVVRRCKQCGQVPERWRAPRALYCCVPCQTKAYRLRHPDQERARSRRYTQANLDRIRARHLRTYQLRRVELRLRQRIARGFVSRVIRVPACPGCGQPFSFLLISHNGSRRYCSKRCSKLATQRKRRMLRRLMAGKLPRHSGRPV